MMADLLDEASNLEEQQRVSAINKIQLREPTPPEFDNVHCIECEDEIPKIRLDLGKFRCVYCQEDLERKEKLFRSKR